jgi:hypothetical protein
MRTFSIASLVLLTLSVHAGAPDPAASKLTWLSGDWQESSASQVVEEHWTTPTANGLIGMSRTVRDGRTVSFEFMRIEQRETGMFYAAQPNGRPATDFKLARSTDGELVFQGDGRDRVKRIIYRGQGAQGLYAAVEGEENGKPFKQEFHYTRAFAVVRP